MEFNAIQIILVGVWAFIVAIDQFDLLESLYQPIVTGAVVGAILGDLPTGLVVGGTYQLVERSPPMQLSVELWQPYLRFLPDLIRRRQLALQCLLP